MRSACSTAALLFFALREENRLCTRCMVEVILMAKILIMEPDVRLGMKMCDVLTHAGHSCAVCRSMAEGMALVEEGTRLVTVLNARLPWKESFTFLRTLEERGWPVLFLTGDEANAQHLRAMYQSTCDVLLSPFDGHALAAAVAELSKLPDYLLTAGNLQMDTRSRQVTKDGRELSLTAQEYALLQALMQSPDAALTREQLLRTAWGYQTVGETRTVDVHIQRLRRKIGSACIETVYKLGYRLKPA